MASLAYLHPPAGRAPQSLRHRMNKFRESAPMGQQQSAHHVYLCAISSGYKHIHSSTRRLNNYGRLAVGKGACGLMIASLPSGDRPNITLVQTLMQTLMQREFELAKLGNNQESDRRSDDVIIVVRSVKLSFIWARGKWGEGFLTTYSYHTYTNDRPERK
ncbi:hypothetical protein K440DRAFT_99563 [Wilcoxina mikolae CBS 423.85]|nr:hypothetical protein K440DRAFT_99563 [Wilcoxina mikolae CBS 423.85]